MYIHHIFIYIQEKLLVVNESAVLFYTYDYLLDHKMSFFCHAMHA
jgi:hypothetical protein